MNLDNELLEAAASGQTESVLELLNRGADIHALDSFCYSLIESPVLDFGHRKRKLPPLPASEDENTVMVRCAKGTDAPLRLAAGNGHTATVKLLLDHGAKVCAADNKEWDAPLRAAAENGHTETAKLLLARGATFYGPLCFAATTGNLTAVKFLINLRADSFPPDTKGMGVEYLEHALCSAAESGHTEIVEFLLDNDANIEAKNTNTWSTPLLYASTNGHIDTVQHLLDRGARISALDDAGPFGPLRVAIENGHTEIVKVLLGHYAKISASNDEESNDEESNDEESNDEESNDEESNDEESEDEESEDEESEDEESEDEEELDLEVLEDAFNHAAGEGHLEIVKLLIDLGVDARADDSEATDGPLRRAAENGHVEIVRLLLLEHGADARAADRKGTDAPLRLAAGNGHVEVVRLLLLEHGADARAADSEGTDAPLRLAARGQRGNVSLLYDFCASSDDDLDQMEIVKILLANGANVHVACDAPLRIAAKYGGKETIELLLDKDADVNAPEGKWTDAPLRMAAQFNKTETVQLLLDRGAHIRAEDHNGRDAALRCAIMSGRKDNISLLFKLYSDQDLGTIPGTTPEVQAAIETEQLKRHRKAVAKAIREAPQIEI